MIEFATVCDGLDEPLETENDPVVALLRVLEWAFEMLISTGIINEFSGNIFQPVSSSELPLAGF